MPPFSLWARVSYRDDFFISYRVYMMTGSFHISLFEGTLHVDKIHVWFKIANITHALPVPVYRQTDFTPKRVVVSRLHDTAARFHTGVKFSPRYKNRGELTPGWLAPAWHFVVVSCKQIKSHEREPEWARAGAKVVPVSCKDPLTCTPLGQFPVSTYRGEKMTDVRNVWNLTTLDRTTRALRIRKD